MADLTLTAHALLSCFTTEIHKNKHAHIPVCADVGAALNMLNRLLAQETFDKSIYAEWIGELDAQRATFPMRYPDRDDVIAPQHAVEVGGLVTRPACHALCSLVVAVQ